MTENSRGNRESLAKEMVDAWDLDDLRHFAVSKMEDYLTELSNEEFNCQWKSFYSFIYSTHYQEIKEDRKKLISDENNGN